MAEYYNKEYYNQIKGNCAYIELNPENIKKVMRALYDSGINFSASYGGYRNTVTVANEDRARAMAIADNYRFGTNKAGQQIIGNTDYSSIRDRNYINTDSATAFQVAAILSGDSSIRFSGVIRGDTESDETPPEPVQSEKTEIDKPVEMLTVNQCVEYAKGLSDYTIRKLVEQNKIPYIRAGNGKRGKILIPKPALIEFLKTGS